VNAAFGVTVPVREFFDAPTVEGLASAIERTLLAMAAALSDEEAERRLERLKAGAPL